MTDTPEQIAEWKRLADAATEGPLARNPFVAQIDAFENGVAIPVCKLLWPTDLRTEAQTEANGDFIVAAWVAVPALIAEVERLTAENERLQYDGDNFARARDKYLGKLISAEAENKNLVAMLYLTNQT